MVRPWLFRSYKDWKHTHHAVDDIVISEKMDEETLLHVVCCIAYLILQFLFHFTPGGSRDNNIHVYFIMTPYWFSSTIHLPDELLHLEFTYYEVKVKVGIGAPNCFHK